MMREWIMRYRALTGRERVLVALALGLSAVVFAVYAVVLPVGHAYDAAQARWSEASDRAGRLRASLAALDHARPAPEAAAGAVGAVAATEAEQAGLVVQSNDARGDGQAQIAINGARAAAVFGWLERVQQRGLVVDALTLSPAADGTIAASVAIRRP